MFRGGRKRAHEGNGSIPRPKDGRGGSGERAEADGSIVKEGKGVEEEVAGL